MTAPEARSPRSRAAAAARTTSRMRIMSLTIATPFDTGVTARARARTWSIATSPRTRNSPVSPSVPVCGLRRPRLLLDARALPGSDREGRRRRSGHRRAGCTSAEPITSTRERVHQGDPALDAPNPTAAPRGRHRLRPRVPRSSSAGRSRVDRARRSRPTRPISKIAAALDGTWRG